MNIEAIGYKINSNIGEDYLEISLQVKTNFNKDDIPYIKLFIHEALENTKAYCNSRSAHRILVVHNYIRKAYSFFLPTYLYSGYRFYKRSIKGRLQASQRFKQKAKIRSIGLLKTSCLFIPLLFAFGAFFEYSNRLPLVFLQENLIKSNDSKITFENYLKFKGRLNTVTNNLNKFNRSHNIKH